MKLSHFIASLGLLVLPLSGYCEGYLSKTEFLNAVRQGDITFDAYGMSSEEHEFLARSVAQIMSDDYKTSPNVTKDCYNVFVNGSEINGVLYVAVQYTKSTLTDEPPYFRQAPDRDPLKAINDGGPYIERIAANNCSKKSFGKQVDFPVINSFRLFTLEVMEVMAEQVAEERERRVMAYQKEQNRIQVEQRRNLEVKQREKIQQKVREDEANRQAAEAEQREQQRIEQEQKEKAARNKKRVAG